MKKNVINLIFYFISFSAIFTGCIKFEPDTPDYFFTQWNSCEALKLGEQWRQAGYHVISMRDDFKTIYGPRVQKVDFTF